MDLSKQYEMLAAQLGDVCYKLNLLEQHKESILQQIRALDKLAGEMKNEAQEKNTEVSPAGTNSPT